MKTFEIPNSYRMHDKNVKFFKRRKMEKSTITIRKCIWYVALLTSSKETFLFGRNFGVTSFAKFAKFILPYLAKN